MHGDHVLQPLAFVKDESLPFLGKDALLPCGLLYQYFPGQSLEGAYEQIEGQIPTWLILLWSCDIMHSVQQLKDGHDIGHVG
ncbi:hypothetical protein WJX73_006268 [Symbiochloris irregularis]|uniref:Uncharacterized protein n=1 Tax=Symbiochloris irregularis TaxID=706552 RepID=A0AAW1NIW9_9CHLO